MAFAPCTNSPAVAAQESSGPSEFRPACPYHNSRRKAAGFWLRTRQAPIMPSPTVSARPAARGGERRRPFEEEIEPHDALDDPVGGQRPCANSEDGGRRAQKRIFDQEHRDQPRPRRAEDFEDRRVGQAGPAIGGERAGEHQRRGQKRDPGRRADRQRELGDQRRDALQRLAHPDAGDVGKLARGRAQEREFAVRPTAGRQGRGDQRAVGRALENVGRIDQHEIDREAAPVDLAKICDPGRDIAPEHVDDDGVADGQAQAFRHVLFHRDQRRTGIVAWPPLTRDDLRTLREAQRRRSRPGRRPAPRRRRRGA